MITSLSDFILVTSAVQLFAVCLNSIHIRALVNIAIDNTKTGTNIKLYSPLTCIVLISNEMHNYYNQFFIPQFLSALHVSNESSRSSSGARHNVLYYTVWYNRYIMPCS